MGDFSSLFHDFLGTVAIYFLPIAIYRYCIRRKTVKRKTALCITIIYAFFSGTVMFVLVLLSTQISGQEFHGIKSHVLLLWSAINYRVLAGKKTTEENISEKKE